MIDVTYGSIKSHKKPGFQTLFRRNIFRKTTEGQINRPSRFRVEETL